MTTLDVRVLPRSSPARTRWIVGGAVAAAVAARLPLLGRPAGADEAGFLLVARQWHAGGGSLYGGYWVDRPPLLISLFQAASALGGLPALRLIGCLAVALLVIGSARAAGLLAGPTAGRWAAVIAAALTLSPLLGAQEVNGELLAAPFVVFGLGAGIAAVDDPEERRACAHASLAGALAVCALMVKQNFADVAVFVVVALLLVGRRSNQRERALALLATAATGAAVTVMLVAGWTVLHGSSPAAVFDAMYPFRLRAGHVMALAGHQHASARLVRLVEAGLVNGMVLLLVLIGLGLRSRRLRGPLEWALAATIAFGVVSVLLGGNYWLHYLVELIGPVSIAAGVLASRHQPGAGLVLRLVLVASIVGGGVGLTLPSGSHARSVGASIRSAASPGDTLVTAYGHADVGLASGLESPYPYLWSLPTKVLDPQLHRLDDVLTGSAAPSWLVTWHRLRSWGLDSTRAQAIVDRDYHPVGEVCGHAIYLHNGLDRPVPSGLGTCPPDVSPATALKELLR